MKNLVNRCYAALVTFWYGPVTEEQTTAAFWAGWATIRQDSQAQATEHPLLRQAFEKGIKWGKFERDVELQDMGIGAIDAFAATQHLTLDEAQDLALQPAV